MWIVAMLLAVQIAPSFDVDRYVKDHAEELKADIQRSRKIRSLSDDQALIVYDQCLSRKAAALSRADIAEEQVFLFARQRCIALKTELLNGSPPARFVRFKALDDAKAASFPALTKQVGDRRRAFDAENGKLPVASH